MSAQENWSRGYLPDVSYDNLGCFYLRIGEEEPYVEGALLQGNFAFKVLSSLCWSPDDPSTLANSTLIILFWEMLKFSKTIFFQIKKYCEG
jgi:hypothetical protein